MRWTIVSILCSAVFGWALPPLVHAGDRTSATASPKVVIPFDFESRFDDGHYGQLIGEMFWKKLQRQGGFILPESMQDVRDWCERNRFVPGPETPLERMKAVVREEQAGDIGIWGKVERVEGHDTDVYDLWINVADFSADPVRMIYTKKVRTRTVSEIPHAYVKEALAGLYGQGKPAPVSPAPVLEDRWAKAANLVQGDFENGRDGPLGWDRLPGDVTWMVEEGKTPRNRVLRFTLSEDVAGSTGVLFYSDFFPIEEGATYRFRCRWRSSGSAVKVFIKGYDELPGAFRTRSGVPVRKERREVYRSQQNLQGDSGAWNVHTEDFTPRHTQFTPRWGRVMLYAYWPAGTVDWDDVEVKQVAPAPAHAGEKDRRPSLETRVRTQDIESGIPGRK